jgi:hypothetical protein
MGIIKMLKRANLWGNKVHVHTIVDIVDKNIGKISHSLLCYSTFKGEADSEEREKQKIVPFECARRLLGKYKTYAHYRIDGNWYWQIVPEGTKYDHRSQQLYNC